MNIYAASIAEILFELSIDMRMKQGFQPRFVFIQFEKKQAAYHDKIDHGNGIKYLVELQ